MMKKMKLFLMAALLLGSSGAVFANEDVCCDTNNCGDSLPCVEVELDWLFWHARKCGLDYAWKADIDRFDTKCGAFTTTEAPETNGSVVTLGRGKPHEVDMDYDSGVRLGFYLPCDCTKYGIRWTHFSADNSDSFKTDHESCEAPYTPSRMHPDIKGFVDGINLFSGRSHYDVDLDQVHLEFHQTWSSSCSSRTSLFGGVHLAFIDQEMETKYKGTSTPIRTGTTGPGTVEERVHKVKENVDMDAYGLHVGFEGYWNICLCFDVFGRVSASALLGDFERSFHEKEVSCPESLAPFVSSTGQATGYEPQHLVSVCDDHWCLVKHCSFAAGISTDFCCGCWDINFELGYEFQQWSDMRNFMQFVDHFEHGAIARGTDSLGFDGLFLRAGIAY